MTTPVTKTVHRGFITRFSKELTWPAEVVLLPPGTPLPDGDAIPYYIEQPDGTLKEFYNHYAPTDPTHKVYCLAEEFTPEEDDFSI